MIGLLAAVAAGGLLAPATPARALFGLFESKPEPKPDSLPYEIAYEPSDDKDVVRILRDNATLERLKDDAPQDGESLARRAEIDVSRLVDALWGEGYYNAGVTITVAGAPVRSGEIAAAGRAADALRGRAVVPIVVRAEPGERFSMRGVRVVAPSGRALDDVPARDVGLVAGDPARADLVRAAQARVVDYYRRQSRPLTKPVDILATVDHGKRVMDAVIVVDPGVVAPIGEVEVSGAPGVDHRVIQSFIYAEPGDAYSPQAMSAMRKSVLRIQALSSARIVEGEALDAYGRLPVRVDVTERPKRAIGASARVSTLDGPALRAYWEHRNLFGGAEFLRLEAETAMLPRYEGETVKSFKDLRWSDFGGRVRATFIKPALGGTRNDFVASALLERARVGSMSFGGYENQTFRLDAGIRHRFSDSFNVQGGLAFETGWARDALGRIDYTLVGAPFLINYDSTDNPLNPTRGFKLIGAATPWLSARGEAKSFFETRLTGSAYYALDEDARYVLAGRVGFGSILGGSLADIPANHRFYAGGSGSVRGYRYNSLGPRLASGDVVGGASLLEASLEARIKITNTIGVVPFIDAGSAFASRYPDFKDRIRWAAGLGLRYYTAIGPIRLDVAFPMNRRKGDRPVAVYFGVGQAF